MHIHRRKAAYLLLLGLVAACTATDPNAEEAQSALGAASAGRAACAFKRGDKPSKTLGTGAPTAAQIPIETIVVLMQENRSFDHYFGHLKQYAETRGIALSGTGEPPGQGSVESAPEGATNPTDAAHPASDPSVRASGAYRYQHAERLCMSDTNHEWLASHAEYNGGRMDGFGRENEGFTEHPEQLAPGLRIDPTLLSGERSMWWYDERDLPFYYDLATTFATGDHYHSSVMGPTFSNRDFLYAATSRGIVDNRKVYNIGLPNQNGSIFAELEAAHVSWAFYIDGKLDLSRAATLGEGYMTQFARDSEWPGGSKHFRPMSEFFHAARNGQLPQVVFLDGKLKEDVHGTDEHPPADVQIGQKWVSDVVHSLFGAPQWSNLALFMVYDEGGGIYDHVAPPAACKPDEKSPNPEPEDQGPEASGDDFTRLGTRVPAIVVSPFAKPHYVSHHVYDHTSILRFIEAKFELPALSQRDANADPMFDFFDFSRPTFAQAPRLAPAEIDPAKLEACEGLFPPNP